MNKLLLPMLCCSGLASIVIGCWQVYPPSAFLVFGVLILFAVYKIVNNRGIDR